MTLSELPERWQAMVEPEPNSGCWLWTGYLNPHGYAWDGQQSMHRLLYCLDYGPIPAKHDLHHRCQTRSCVNPSHLEALTRRAHAHQHDYANKTHCINGHEFAVVGFYLWANGTMDEPRRRCKACQLIRDRKRRLTKQGAIRLASAPKGE